MYDIMTQKGFGLAFIMLTVIIFALIFRLHRCKLMLSSIVNGGKTNTDSIMCANDEIYWSGIFTQWCHSLMVMTTAVVGWFLNESIIWHIFLLVGIPFFTIYWHRQFGQIQRSNQASLNTPAPDS